MKLKIGLTFFYIGLIIFWHQVVYAQSNTSFLNTTSLMTEPSEYLNTVEFGLGYVSDDSYRFGEYSGAVDQGLFALGNVYLKSASANDVDDSRYGRLIGTNLGLDSRNLYAEYGDQGKFNTYIRYDQQPRYRGDDIATPFLGAGTVDQTLPVDWVAANTTAGMSALSSSLTAQTLKTERQNYTGGFSWLFSEGWEFSGNYQHETKRGQDAIAAIFGTNGGNPRGAMLVQPINYSTDEYNLSLHYTGQSGHFSLAYHLSQFYNEHHALEWNNPYLRAPVGNTWAPGTDYAAGVKGQLSLMPDNQAQQFNIAGSYILGPSSRLNANISYGEMQQNDAFLPYTINPNLNVPSELPRVKLDGQIDTLFANIAYSVRPLRKLSIRAAYTYDNRDNNTPRNLYQRVRSDSGHQGDLISSDARINTPYSFEMHQFKIDMSYRLASAHKLTIGFDDEQRQRNFSEVETTKERTSRIKLASNLSQLISAQIEYAHSDRGGSEYLSNRPFLDGHNPDYIATLAENNQYINDPLMRKFNLADRVQDKWSTSVNFSSNSSWAFGVSGQYRTDDYKKSELGVEQSRDNSVTLDLSYMPNETFDSYLFLTQESMSHMQNGYQRAGVGLYPGISREPPLCAGCGFWNVDTKDNVDTIGAGLNWLAFEKRVKLSLTYTYSRAVTTIEQDADVNINHAPLPELSYRLHSLNFTGHYQIKENMDFRMRLVFQQEHIQDFAQDDISPNTLSNIILLGNNAPDYSNSLVGVSLIYRF